MLKLMKLWLIFFSLELFFLLMRKAKMSTNCTVFLVQVSIATALYSHFYQFIAPFHSTGPTEYTVPCRGTLHSDQYTKREITTVIFDFKY